MTMEASFRALDAFISPSAAITLARASRDASASAAIALWSCTGSFTSLISTRSTFIPQASVCHSGPFKEQSWKKQEGGWLCCCWDMAI
uniref:PRO0720 n=1 Tax=Homo sapiens TaxID=9606 RepID=Q9H376_HUMAN|nr:PRO0720 [Homo sapiens]